MMGQPAKAAVLPWALALALGFALQAPSRARASGFASPTVGPSSAGVSTVDPVGVSLNPGSLGFIEQARVVAGGNLVLGDLRYQRERRATYQNEDSLDFALPIDPLLIDHQ